MFWLAKLNTTTRVESTKNVFNSHPRKLVAFITTSLFIYLQMFITFTYVQICLRLLERDPFHLKSTLVHLATAMELGHSNDLYLLACNLVKDYPQKWVWILIIDWLINSWFYLHDPIWSVFWLNFRQKLRVFPLTERFIWFYKKTITARCPDSVIPHFICMSIIWDIVRLGCTVHYMQHFIAWTG